MKRVNQYNKEVLDFYESLWKQKGGKLKDDISIKEKTDIVLDKIPNDVKTIIDIGCGDGAITNVLADKYIKVIGLEQSKEALKYISDKVDILNCNASKIPINENTIDLVFSSEMIEHLDDENLGKVIDEIKRITKKYIMISVPNNEDLRKRFIKCNNCNHKYHIYGHYQSFNFRRMKNIFYEYTLIDKMCCGAMEPISYKHVSYLINILSNKYFYIDTMKLICIKCGRIIKPIRINNIQKVIYMILKIYQKLIKIILNRKNKSDWIIVLFRKR